MKNPPKSVSLKWKAEEEKQNAGLCTFSWPKANGLNFAEFTLFFFSLSQPRWLSTDRTRRRNGQVESTAKKHKNTMTLMNYDFFTYSGNLPILRVVFS